MTTLYAILQKNPNHFRDMHEECDRIWQWGFDPQAQAELRAEVGRALGVDDAFMARVHHYPIHANTNLLSGNSILCREIVYHVWK
jgi:hypothetical protein